MRGGTLTRQRFCHCPASCAGSIGNKTLVDLDAEVPLEWRHQMGKSSIAPSRIAKETL